MFVQKIFPIMGVFHPSINYIITEMVGMSIPMWVMILYYYLYFTMPILECWQFWSATCATTIENLNTTWQNTVTSISNALTEEKQKTKEWTIYRGVHEKYLYNNLDKLSCENKSLEARLQTLSRQYDELAEQLAAERFTNGINHTKIEKLSSENNELITENLRMNEINVKLSLEKDELSTGSIQIIDQNFQLSLENDDLKSNLSKMDDDNTCTICYESVRVTF